jgi:phosphoribosylanthranilate isomerase
MMRPEDAAAASRLGADAIGMIFHPPSKRNVGVERAREIVGAIGPFVTPVGVFVNARPSHIIEVARALGLRIVQLNGQEGPEQVGDLRAAGLKVLKAVRVDAAFSEQLAQWRSALEPLRDTLIGLVLETANTEGGSGLANDWDAVRRHQESGDFSGLPPLIAAGGLRPDSVESVVRFLRPWAVDVSSGVESSSGVKSVALMEAFIRAVQRGAS